MQAVQSADPAHRPAWAVHLTPRQVYRDVLGVSEATFYRMLNDPRAGFPSSVSLSRGRKGYDREAVMAWVAAGGYGAGKAA